MPPCTHRRIAAAALVALAVIYAQQFLSVHELEHLFDPGAVRCVYAPLASAAGGALMPAPPALAVPPARAAAHVTPPAQPCAAAVAPRQARGPPAV